MRSILSIGSTNDIQSPAEDPRLKTKHISAHVRDCQDSSSTGNDYGVHQMDTPLEGSCSGSAVERNEGHVKPVSTSGRGASATVERRVHTSAAEMASEPLPGDGQRDGHAAENSKMIVKSSHSTRQEQEKHGKEGVRNRDRHQKERREVSEHRPRSDDHRSDPRHHGNRDSKKGDDSHRNHHRREQKNGAHVESKSNCIQRERSRYHSSHCDRDRNRDRGYDHLNRDCERAEGSAFQGRQMEPGQNNIRLDNKFPSTITTSLDINVSNEDELHCNNGLEIDTQDPHFISLIENNAAHNTEYFVKLRQQERQFSKSTASPVENGWSPAEHEWSPAQHEFTSAEIEFAPAETTLSPNETTPTRVPYPGIQPRVETTVPRAPNSGVSRRIEALVSRVPSPGVSPRVETTVSRLPNPGVSPRVETTVSRLPNPGVSPRVETTVSRVSNPQVQPKVETTVNRASNAVASTRVEKAVSQAPNLRVSDTSNPLPTRITQHRSSSYSSVATLPSTSSAAHSNALSRRTSGAAASSFSLSSGLDISQPSTSFGGNQSLNRRESRSELDPDAQRASDRVRSRYPLVKGPPIIPVSSVVGRWEFHRGSRKRKAHADTVDVSSLRQRASGGGSSPPIRSAIGAAKKKTQEEKKKKMQKKKMQDNYRGRKNWK